MKVTLTVIDGPHCGESFTFSGHDTFLVGRSRHAHFRLPAKDQFFSRVHFMIEVNPPACRLVDMGSHNGTYVNGQRALTADLHHGDQIRAGHSVFFLQVVEGPEATSETVSFHVDSKSASTQMLPAIPGFSEMQWAGSQPLGLSLLGTDDATGANVSISVVRPSHPATEPQIAELLAEARKLATLEHPAIRKLRDLGVGENFLWFAYDAAPNEMRATQLAKPEPSLAIRRVLGWTIDLIAGLDQAHRQGFVHRDIRPSGILISEQNGKESASWGEYGLARLLADAPFGGVTTFADPESAAFWPPEFLTDYRNPTPLGDQYSLAASVYWLLTGHFLFDMPPDANRRYSVLLKQQVVPIRRRRPEIPERVAAALELALARNPEKRHADLSAFRTALAGR